LATSFFIGKPFLGLQTTSANSKDLIFPFFAQGKITKFTAIIKKRRLTGMGERFGSSGL
jgi:hypothetical protein